MIFICDSCSRSKNNGNVLIEHKIRRIWQQPTFAECFPGLFLTLVIFLVSFSLAPSPCLLSLSLHLVLPDLFSSSSWTSHPFYLFSRMSVFFLVLLRGHGHQPFSPPLLFLSGFLRFVLLLCTSPIF